MKFNTQNLPINSSSRMKMSEKHMQTHSIKALLVGEHQETVDVKKIRGKRNTYYRIKLGDWHIVYAIIKNKIVVINTLIAGVRGDIYKKMGGLKQ